MTNPICGKPTSPEHGLAVEKIVYQLYPSPLGCCRLLLHEGRYVLYKENDWLAVTWSGVAQWGRDEPYDVFRRAGLKSQWLIDSKRYGRLLGRLRSEEEDGEEYMPDVIFSLKSSGGRPQVRLIPTNELALVIRALYVTFSALDLNVDGRPEIRIRMRLPLTQGKSQAEQLIFPILLWIAPVVTSVRLGSTCASEVPRDSDLASTAYEIFVSLGMTATRRAFAQCQSLANALDQVRALWVQGIGRSIVAKKLFLILGHATDVIPAYQRLPLQDPGGGRLRFLCWNSRIRRAAAWGLATLDQSWFNYIDDTEYNSVLAARRHRLLLALFAKKLIARSQAPEDRPWQMRVLLRTAELHASLENWSDAWSHLLQAVLMSPESTTIGHLGDPAAKDWAIQELIATYQRVCGDDSGLVDFLCAYMGSTSHDDFHKVLWAWVEPKSPAEWLEFGKNQNGYHE